MSFRKPQLDRSRSSQTAREGFTFQAIVTRPISVGSVELCSDSHTDRPAIRTGKSVQFALSAPPSLASHGLTWFLCSIQLTVMLFF